MAHSYYLRLRTDVRAASDWNGKHHACLHAAKRFFPLLHGHVDTTRNWLDCILHIVKRIIMSTNVHMWPYLYLLDPCYSTNMLHVLECRSRLFMTLGGSVPPPKSPFCPPSAPSLPDPSSLSEKEAREELLRIARAVIQWDEAYYGEDKPLVSDEEVRHRNRATTAFYFSLLIQTLLLIYMSFIPLFPLSTMH